MSFRKISAGLLSTALSISPAVLAQEPPVVTPGAEPSTYVMNVREVDIHVFAEEVSSVTGRTLILDPSVSGKVTVVSQSPLTQDGVWDLFQNVLRVHGYTALPSGPGWRIVAQNEARQAGPYSQVTRTAGGDVVTQLVQLENLPAAEAARALAPFVSDIGAIEPFTRPNGVIVTGYAEDIRRIVRLASQLDSADQGSLEAIQINYARAAETAEMIRGILQDENGLGPRLVADERSNQILVRGSAEEIREARRLVTLMDTADGVSIQTRVLRLSHSDAESVLEVLRGLVGGDPAASNAVAHSLQTQPAAPSASGIATLTDNPAFGGQPTRAATPRIARSSGRSEGVAANGLSIQSAPDINAIVVRGSPASIAEVESLVSELDIRRPQVLIEAAIVEITGDAAEQFGVQLGLGDAAPDGGVAATSFSDQGLSVRRILATLGSPAAVGITEDGLSLGGAEDDFGILVQAFGSSTNANLLSTPSLTTLDNQPAEIVVGQNVPFRTGSFTTTGNSTNPFTTIEREDVGITLSVLPRIYDGNVIRLDVTQEVSSLVAGTVPGASDLITNRRSIQTTVLADDGGTVVLGGLITDDRISSESKVPVLGDVPVVGNLFKNSTESGTKRTLFVFLRPVVLRTQSAVAAASAERYDRLRDAERNALDRGSLLIDGDRPRLSMGIEGIY